MNNLNKVLSMRGSPAKRKGISPGLVSLKTRALFGAAGLIFSADQAFKSRMDSVPDQDLPTEPEGPAGEFVRFTRYHNRGFALGRMKEHEAMVKGTGVLGTGMVLMALIRSISKREGLIKQAGLSLVFGGALSNVFDRFTRGYVVDYIIIKKGPLRKLIINIGDAAIFVGSLLYAAASLIFGDRK